MSCDTEREKIQAFIDGELSEEETAVLREHCMSCPSCAKYLREMLAMQKAVNELAEDTVPEGLHNRIMAAYRREKRGFLPWIKRNPVIAVAAVLVIVVGTVYGTGVLKASFDSNMRSAALSAENVQEKADEEGVGDRSMGYAALTTAAGATTQAQLSTTAAAVTTKATTAGAVVTSPATAAATTAADSDKLKTLREEAEKMIPDLPVTEEYSFVRVVKTESIPIEFDEWTAVTDREYNGESVTILYAIVSEERAQEILDATLVDSSYYCDDASVYPKLTASAENGLFIMIVPQGA
ncbi:MAG: zf-HC2 domain-containing protein [Clostridiaceae bacterium]|nr:zf-HC2 domain-containing protein [Clostridiaceae bacterium]